MFEVGDDNFNMYDGDQILVHEESDSMSSKELNSRYEPS